MCIHFFFIREWPPVWNFACTWFYEVVEFRIRGYIHKFDVFLKKTKSGLCHVCVGVCVLPFSVCLSTELRVPCRGWNLERIWRAERVRFGCAGRPGARWRAFRQWFIQVCCSCSCLRRVLVLFSSRGVGLTGVLSATCTCYQRYVACIVCVFYLCTTLPMGISTLWARVWAIGLKRIIIVISGYVFGLLFP